MDLLSWRWVFFVNVPIGIAACIFSFFFLQEYRDRTAGHFDLAGSLLAGSGLALVMYALSEGPSYGWTSISILGSAVGGLLGAGVVMALLSLMESDTSLWWMRLLIFLARAGMGFSFLSAQTATFATISPRATGQASALANALRQIGSALGVAVVGSALGIVGPTLESATGAVVPNLAAYHAAFLAAAVLEAIAAVFAFTIHDRDAAATMRRQIRPAEDTELSGLSPRVETGR